jgi:hypothetical protein
VLARLVRSEGQRERRARPEYCGPAGGFSRVLDGAVRPVNGVAERIVAKRVDRVMEDRYRCLDARYIGL